MTTWHRFQRGDQWVWAMESPIYQGNSWRDGCEFWTNVLLPEARPDRRFWSFGQSAESAARTGETATDVRLVTLEEWKAGVHGEHGGEKEGK